ncbi:RING finger protein B [Holothuria leucospilota]|uniref:RING finger protein B n=1 Tax=Holothuria leucospilota TaxID=206669 RepID=A0A9Q1HGF5_HOLLE|nr:RING finger protein B [Holothuria leucospilota]
MVPASRRLRLSDSVKNSETPRRNKRSLSKVSPAADCTEDKPTERWGHAMCVTGPDTMMLVGGQGAGQVISKDALWELNSSTSTWSVPEVEQLVSRPELRTGHTITYDHVLNLLYVFGGSKNVRWYNDMFVLDLSDKQWSFIDAEGNAPTRAYHTSTFFRGEMFVFGGIYPNPNLEPDSCSNDLFIFSSVSNNWYKPLVLGPKPKPRSGHSATLLGDKLVIFGGWDAPVCFNDVYILDLGLMEFSSPVVEGKAPSPRSWHASCALSNNRVLIHGGYNGYHALSDAFVFSLDTLRWQQVTLEGSGPVGARAGHTICVIPDGIDEGAVTDKIVMFGGGDNEDNFFNDLIFITAP